MPRFLFAAALALSVAGSARADDVIDVKPDRCVTDQARLFTPMMLRQIYDVCTQLDRAGVAQIGVATVSNLGDRSRAEYAVDLFKKWGLGHGKQRSDGLLVFLSPSEKKAGSYGVRVEVGDGLEGALPDAKVGRLIDEFYIPERDRGQPGTGAVKLVQAIGSILSKDASAGGDAAATPQSVRDGQRSGRARRGGGGLQLNAAALGLAVLTMLALLVVLASAAMRQSFPGKGVGILALALIGATVVGLFSMTAAGAGWIAFIVGLVVNGIAFFSIRSHKCPKDGSWMVIDTEVVEAPTYFSDGMAEVWEHCTNKACGYERRYEKILPRKEVHVVTTGGGGGGFGGGGGGGGGDNDSFSGGGGESSGGGAERD